MKSIRISFRFKIMLMCLLVVLLTAGSIGYVTYDSMRDNIYAEARDDLAEVARLNAELIARPFKLMASNAGIIAATPPLDGIMSAQALGSDQLATVGTSGSERMRRLERIFASVLRQNPSYTQLRLIGLANDGREIVRVDRDGDRIRIVSRQDLQQKGAEPYMLRLRTARGPYFSEVTYNREDGAIQIPRVPTVRLVYPVRSQTGALFGAIVINANYESLLSSVTGSLATEYRLTVLNEAGDYLVINADGTRSPLQVREDPRWTSNDLVELAAEGGPGFLLDGQTAAHVGQVDILPQRSGMRLKVIASVPCSVLLGSAQAALHQTFALVLGLAVLTLLIAWFVADRLTQPMRRLIARIEARRSIFEPIELDGTAPDEIGKLAQAYSDLANDMIRQAGESFSIFQNAADGIVTVARDGTILSANPAAHKMFRFTDGTLPGRNVEELIPKDSRARHRDYMKLVREPNVGSIMGQNRDVFGLRKNKEKFPLEASLSAVGSGPETTYVVVLRDTSMRKAQESTLRKTIAELAHTQRNLERSNKELDRFAYVASNGLKRPLHGIDTALQTLEQDVATRDDAALLTHVQVVRDRIGNMDRLLDDLLQHARIGWEKVPTQTAPGRKILEDVIDQTEIPESFTVEVDPAIENLELQVMPLQTVLLNLVQNAVKHHHKPDGRVRISVREQKNVLTFAVTDDGPGIDPKDHDRVFNAFETLDPKARHQGSGIGLAIVKKIVELAGGRISLISAPGSGSSFRFTWPKAASFQLSPDKAA